VVIVPFQAFADISCGGILDGQAQCAQSPVHLVESGSSRLHS